MYVCMYVYIYIDIMYMLWIPHHCNWSWVTRTFTHSRSAPSSIPGWYVHLSTLAQGTIGEVSGRDSFWCLLAIGLLHLDLVDVVVLESQGLYPVLVRRLISPLQSCFGRSAESLGIFASAGVSLEKRRVPALWCLGGRSCQLVAVYDPSTLVAELCLLLQRKIQGELRKWRINCSTAEHVGIIRRSNQCFKSTSSACADVRS